MDAPQHSGPPMVWSADPHLSHGSAGPDPEAWSPERSSIRSVPAGELARRLGEVDLSVLRPAELVQFSLAAAHLAQWAEALRVSAVSRLARLADGQ
ncbi:hypothetical protein SPF06_07470 [Sinomonas sp. JGH33]|uniref:Uncharacterized protein n=1 Tax=Sinomonas terricola TaxID=3110330 RepID=A0ABU5T4T8_9MICC|nr:hypothetical protein [Sinomonas sp. JGH33]MEA5454557.1 hypothetical protein [Sinomonas sp. JGH33]